MTNLKCAQCGLVNFPSAADCKRCGASLDSPSLHAIESVENADDAPAPKQRGILKRVVGGVALSGVLLLCCHVSLLESSEAANFEQKQLVHRAIAVIERSGFDTDAFLLRRLANYRTTDNWWNNWNGHGEAYAATNFPFQIVTLYPEFFKYSTDDVERAAILLHEARHLSGRGEETAFAGVWRDKAKLGWTKEQYGHTRVWKNVLEFTQRYAPELFRCGADALQDCAEGDEQKASAR
ncbi:MAG TPA: hypothetical protein VM934_05670 [Pyrinomonadaceae bacterium]|jgi:hypothetical protein|nr:hypothetical protein [Pyrinomonadaceae bacterium]